MLLVPSDPLAPRRVDPHLAAEADAARSCGLPVAVVDHDEVVRAGAEDVSAAVRAVPRGTPGRPTTALYRGWMIPAERYATLAQALAERDVVLLTGPEAYRRAHELPGWYGALEAWTPRSVWTVGTGAAALADARRAIGSGPLVLRDHVKSMKHAWDEAAFVPAAQVPTRAGVPDPLLRVAARFVELRGEDLVGGLVLRELEAFVGPEARTWWVDGSCVLVAAHPDTPDEVPDGLDAASLTRALPGLADAVQGLGTCFVTVDVVRRADGAWRVVELGDGQVSDRPSSVSAERFVTDVVVPLVEASARRRTQPGAGAHAE